MPLTLKAANAYVLSVHRHHPQATGCRFCLGAYADGQLVGVAIVGRTTAKALQQQTSAEVVRLATNGHRNACSLLYGACRRVWLAMGGRADQLYTYIQGDETGVSLRAAGWRLDAVCPPRPNRGWNSAGRARANTSNPGRQRWVAA